MRILVLHQNKFERLAYDRAVDHDRHDVVYAGTADYIANIPPGVRCGTVTWDETRPVTDQLRPWLRRQAGFERILTRHEQLILPAAELREELDIPGMRPPLARRFRDKVAMKEAVRQAGIRVPRFVPARATEAPWTGRTVLKPRDGAGSKGIWLCQTFAEARRLVASQERASAGFADRYELEEFLDGPIWHVDGYLFHGEPVAIQPSRYVSTPLALESGVPLGSVQHPEPELESWTLACLEALGADTLTFHLEAIMTAAGPVFMEVAARCGGGYIVDEVHRRTGVYMHTLDMASDVDGALATRLIGRPDPDNYYGMFLYPGHTYGGAPCVVPVPPDLLDDPCLLTYRMYPPDTPTPTKGSYRPENLAFSGMVCGPDPMTLEKWLQALFDEVVVEARPGG